MRSGSERLSSASSVPASSGRRTQSFSVVTSMAFRSRAHRAAARLPLGIGVMVGEGARPISRAPLCDMSRRISRIGDAGKRDHRQHAEPARVAARHDARRSTGLAAEASANGAALPPSPITSSASARAICAERRAQGPRRHHQAVADAGAASTTIRLILGKLRVLEAVIHDDDASVGRLDRLAPAARSAATMVGASRAATARRRPRRRLALGTTHRPLWAPP